MIKNTYKKRKRRETFGKKALTVGGIVAAGVTEAATGYKVSGAIGKGASKAGKALGTAGKNIKSFGSSVKKSFTDAYNPPAPKKIPKSRRLTAGPGPELDKTKLLGEGSKKNYRPGTMHTPKPTGPVKRGQGGRPKGPKMSVPKLTGGLVGEQKIGGRRIGSQTLNTTGMPKGPGTKTGSFKPKLSMDNKLMGDYKSIAKTKASAKKRQTNLIKNAPGKAMQPGDTVGARSKARDSVAKKVKASRKRTTNKVAKIQKGIDTKAKQVAKNTGRPVGQVKKINKALSTKAGKDKLQSAFLGSRGIKPKVKLNAAAMLNPAGMAISQIEAANMAAYPERYTKGILGGTVGKKSIPGLIAQTPTGKKIKKRVSGLKSKVKTRFKF
tara:strand:+ start:871 stop:2013 length:1143 start_codon:yes stop_codon:yes gene_type:complete